MKGVFFNDIHSYRDLNLILAPFEVPPAPLKENYIDIPGGDAGLDLTEAFGEPKYDYREFDLIFSVLPGDDWEEKKRQVSNLLHGTNQTIVFDRNPNYCLRGRLTVSDYKSNKLDRKITIHAKTEPYWLRTAKTIHSFNASAASKNLVDRMNKWIVTGTGAASSVKVENDIITISEGTEIYVWSNRFSVEGLSTLSFSSETNISSYRIRAYCFTSHGQSTNDANMPYIILTNGKYENWTIPTNTVEIQIRLMPRSFPAEISKFQVESGSTATAFEPKSGIYLTNNGRPVIPEITAAAAVNITDWNDNVYSLSKGKHKILDISIPQAGGIITADNNITVEYTERMI